VNPRRKAREIALAFLYQWDVRGDEVLPELDDLLIKDCREPDVAEYVKILVRGTIEKREEIDKRISEAAEHWASNAWPSSTGTSCAWRRTRWRSAPRTCR